MRNPDVIVIGAGMIGATCALKLMEAGLTVLVIDRSSIASGTTSAGEGNILVSDKDSGPELTLALRSRQLWFDMQSEIQSDFELEAKGGIVVARDERGSNDLASLASRQSSEGVITEKLDESSLRELEPNISRDITGGYLYPQDSQCQPMLAVAQILRCVRQRGGEVISGQKVIEINTDNVGVIGVTTQSQRFNSRVIVNATGTWAGEIAKLAGSDLPIAPRRGVILVTAPYSTLIRHKVYDAGYVSNVSSGSADLQTSAVIEGTKSGTILIGSSRERVGFSSAFSVDILRRLAQQAISLFPVLENVKLMRTYHGFRPYAPDHLPIIGEDAKVRGLWHATGHEGAGIGLAPATAELVVNQVMGWESFMDASAFSPSRFVNSRSISHD